MYKKLVVFGLFIIMSIVAMGCSNDGDDSVSREKEDIEAISDEEYIEKYGKVDDPLFIELTKDQLTEEEKEIVSILENQSGINLMENRLFVIVPNETEKIRYITETHPYDTQVRVYLRKVSLNDNEGKDVIIGRVENIEDSDKEVWFYDVETNNPIVLNEEEEIVDVNNEKELKDEKNIEK